MSVTDTSEQAFAAKLASLGGTLVSAMSWYHAAWQVVQVDGAEVDSCTFGLGELGADSALVAGQVAVIVDARKSLPFSNNAEICWLIALLVCGEVVVPNAI